MLILLRIILALSLSASPFIALAAPVQIGMKTVDVPTPLGYGRVPESMDRLLSLLDSFTTPTTQSLALFLSEDDLSVAIAGGIPEMTRRYVVQIPKVAIDYNVTQSSFDAVKSKVRADFESKLNNIEPDANELLDKASGEVSQKLGSDVEMALDSFVALPVHGETPNSISLSILSRYSITTNDGERTSMVATATVTFIRVKNTMLVLQVYGSKDDLEWTREQSKSWIQAVTAANMAP